jgi:hypothetical protein
MDGQNSGTATPIVINAIDVNIVGEAKTTGEQVYNPAEDGAFYSFLMDVIKNEKVIGFKFDGGTQKFSVILGE